MFRPFAKNVPYLVFLENRCYWKSYGWQKTLRFRTDIAGFNRKASAVLKSEMRGD